MRHLCWTDSVLICYHLIRLDTCYHLHCKHSDRLFFSKKMRLYLLLSTNFNMMHFSVTFSLPLLLKVVYAHLGASFMKVWYEDVIKFMSFVKTTDPPLILSAVSWWCHRVVVVLYHHVYLPPTGAFIKKK